MTISIPLILALAGSVANISDGSTSLDAKIAGAGGSCYLRAQSLSDDTHSSAGAHSNTADNTSAASQPVDRTRTAAPSIASFSAESQTLLIGGDVYQIETAAKSYSIASPDPQTLRFEVHRGDNWAAGGDGSGVDRSEIQNDSTGVATSWGAVIPAGTPIGLDYQFMVEANSNGTFVNTQNHSNGFFVVGQMHNDDIASGVPTSPPFAVQMDGERLQIVARYVLPGGNPRNSSSALHMLTLWTDPNPIQTGVYNDIRVRANFSNSGNGYLNVWINGKQVANYQGALGFGQGTYWEYGIYRSRAAETSAVRYRTLMLTIDSSTPVSSRRP
ncbi:heparin lyase I family protein [Bradyrhizobium sp. LLZ17]|uniref:Heparin lyase I family protein n=1 Tax=Bradyrhizobium sp. LLZ17 TaxID=3239388 RepID=A0AB39XKH3_9BRAD